MDAWVRCAQCWKRVPATARFCRRCGAPLRPPVPPPRPGGGGIGVGALGVLGLLFAIAVFVLFVCMFSVRSAPAPIIYSPAPVPRTFEPAHFEYQRELDQDFRPHVYVPPIPQPPSPPTAPDRLRPPSDPIARPNWTRNP